MAALANNNSFGAETSEASVSDTVVLSRAKLLMHITKFIAKFKRERKGTCTKIQNHPRFFKNPDVTPA